MLSRIYPISPFIRQAIVQHKRSAPRSRWQHHGENLIRFISKSQSGGEIGRGHKFRNRNILAYAIIISGRELRLESSKCTGIPAFCNRISVIRVQVDFIIGFLRPVFAGPVQSVSQFKPVVPKMFSFFIIGLISALKVKSYGVITTGSPVCQTYLGQFQP